MRILLLLSASFLAIYQVHAYSAATCPSNIPEFSREDCYPSGGASESSCISKGCLWCETADYSNPNQYPWCFYDTSATTQTPSGECTDCSCQNKRDCYPEAGSSQSGCLARGCLWCESNIQGEPWCFHSDNTATAATGATQSPGECTTCSCSNKIDCYPEPGSSEQGCASRGCLWCPSGIQGEPWCITSNGVTAPPGTGGGGGVCPTDIPESNRIDCWPGGGASAGGCVDSGCIWCESNTPDTPWCFFNTTDLPEGIPDEERINCIPEGGFSPNECEARGCVFASAGSQAAPMCYFPDTYGYQMVGSPVSTATGFEITLARVSAGSLYGNDAENLLLTIDYDTDYRIHWKFTDIANSDRFEVPLTINGASGTKSINTLYDFAYTNNPVFSFQIVRKSSGAVLWDTSLGGLTFSDQFLQIATRVPEGMTVYGFGETEHETLKHKFDWSAWGMYSRDQPPAGVGNLYSVHPFYVAIEQDASSHGVLLLNSAAQDITFTPAPGLLYRTIGGVLDFYMFFGPEPKAVIEQYNEAIGKPFFPPYWSLGFQLCRYGYGSLKIVQETVQRMDSYGIPLDVQYGDIDYMDEQRDFTYDHTTYAGLPEYVKELQAGGKHYVIILDPCLTADDPPGAYPPYERGVAADAYVKNADGTDALGKVWPPGNSVFPDYSSPSAQAWWTDECKRFHDVISFDGLWIDMNEPANFVTGSVTGCNDNTINYPPYHPLIWGDTLADKSMCPDAQHFMGSHYDTHSLYGWSEAYATYNAAYQSTNKRPFVVSRSTFPGSGTWAAHWLGDNNSGWSDLKNSVIGMLEFNFFGIPYIGADICGFNGNVNEDLCERWMELGSFYPYARNHNGIGYAEQDPASFGDTFAARAKYNLETRYTLLPYLYTLFYEAATKGSGVVRPLSFEFPTDAATHTIDEQFMWGSGLLFSPVLYEGLSSVDAYFPDARWYDYYNGVEVGVRQGEMSVPAPLGTIPIHVRGGSILPTQDPAVNTVLSRNNPFGLIIALDDSGNANGELFWDDGDTMETIENGDYALFRFSVSNGQLTTALINPNNIINSMVMGSLRIFGVTSNPSTLYVNGMPKPFSFSNGVIEVDGINEVMSASFNVQW
ncbi:lysosomal alpha-glucosidase-like [Styela clava]